MKTTAIVQTSITKKIISYILLLIIIAVTATLVPTLYFFTTYAEKSAEEQVIKGMQGLNTIMEHSKEQAMNYGIIFANHPGLSKAMEEKDAPTILTILAPLVKEAKIDFVTVTDEKGKVITRTHAPTQTGDSVMNQANVAAAVKGQAFSAVEPGTAVKLSARAGVPVKNQDGKIVGVISVGYAVSNESIVDRAKDMFDTDVTLFLGDTRIATTIMKDGQRIIGTKLNEKVANIVLQEQKTYVGRAEILGKNYMTAYMPLLGPDNKTIGVIFAGRDSATTDLLKNKIITTISCIFVVMFIIIFGATKFTVGKMIRPLQELAYAVEIVANGDLTYMVTVTSKDEIGILGNGFNKMIEHLKMLVIQVNDLSSSVAGSAAILKESSDVSATAAEQVTSAIREVAKGVETQVDAIEETSTIIEEMSTNITDIATNAASSAERSKNMATAATEGGKAITTAVNQMQCIENAVSHSAQVVEKLGERSEEIGQIVVAIAAIASQTNLLALNAAIEAARAGEQGRGFAVVAEEVRKLAEQSQGSAKQITTLISKIQEDTTKAIIAMSDGKKEVTIGAQVVASAGIAFANITDLIKDVSAQVYRISLAAQQMTAGSKHIVNSVQDIGNVSKTTAGQMEKVSEATEEQSAAVTEMAAASQHLLLISQKLQQVITQFKI